MAVIQFGSPVTKPLLRRGTPKPIPPDARAYDTFRVTQQFADTDFFYKDGRKHNATDIGNFRCGDPVVAMAGGIAQPLRDKATLLGAPTDALGVRVDHGNGLVTEVWHLDRIDITAGQRVKPGDQLGIVGDTGLGTVCHCHVEAKRNGVRIDPEPLMFGGFVVVGEDDLASPFGTGTVNAGVWLREGPGTQYDKTIGETFDSPIDVNLVAYEANGGKYEAGGQTRSDWFQIEREKRHWVAAAFVGHRKSTLFPVQQADCSAVESKLKTAEETVATLKTKISAAQAALR